MNKQVKNKQYALLVTELILQRYEITYKRSRGGSNSIVLQ